MPVGRRSGERLFRDLLLDNQIGTEEKEERRYDAEGKKGGDGRQDPLAQTGGAGHGARSEIKSQPRGRETQETGQQAARQGELERASALGTHNVIGVGDGRRAGHFSKTERTHPVGHGCTSSERRGYRIGMHRGSTARATAFEGAHSP